MKRLFLIAWILVNSIIVLGQGMSWEEVVANREGTLKVYWYPNNIKIPDSKDVLDGVEQDLIYAFAAYLNKKYQLQVEVDLIETDSFEEVMDIIKDGTGGMMGASSISITEERSQFLRFAPPYLSDIAVLVSSASMPLAHTEEEFREIFDQATAVTIEHTTLINALKDLKQKENLNFNFELVKNSGEILGRIGELENGFGYIDLPNFMDVTAKDPRIQRQFFYPIKLSGLALVYPMQSDWDVPINEYYASEQFMKDKTRIITKYLGEDVEAIFDQLARSAEFGPFEEIVISAREREMQFRELLEATQRDQDKNARIYLLASIAIIALFSVIFLYARYQIKARSTELLMGQQRTIENHNQQLTRLNQEKNDLIEVLAHDLRSPLSKIAGFSRLLSESDQIRPEEKELNGYIMKSSEEMESMISKILDVEAIESGNRNLQLEKLDVSVLGKEVISELEDKANAKSISIHVQDCDGCYVLGDRFYLRQIIENLLSNAIKFSPKGKGIDYMARVEGQFICIAVKDEGPGIEEEDRERLFNKYQTAALPTGGEASTGLGLWIVKLFSEIMHGSVRFETELNKGTTFYVRLPMAA
ncbi:MAG: ATP-binding protein [Cytophagales bacterium]|nr:ATP-binding protein [Cytophagales bacterium]